MAEERGGKNEKRALWLVLIAVGLVLVFLVVWFAFQREELLEKEEEVPVVDPREDLIREQTEALEEKMKDFEPLTEEEIRDQTKALEELLSDF